MPDIKDSLVNSIIGSGSSVDGDIDVDGLLRIDGDVRGSVRATGKVVVEGVNLCAHHIKARKPGEESGIIKSETPIYASKVMVVCPRCGQPTRVGHKIREDGSKARACKKCGEPL